ncbi:MAG: M12 family metallo-peptidase, partial [Lentisphaeraceae bacterium]|nr:M12 family metallo-peptidase [Lentisphaeraceae bacterium]
MYKRNLTLLVCASFLAIVTLCWQNKTKVKFVDNDHLNNPEEETSSSENFTKSAAVNLNPIINERHIVNKKLFYEKEIDDPVSGLKTLRNKNLKLDVNKFSTLSVGDKIKLEFFKDTQYEAIVTSTSTDVNGTKGLVLEVEGYDKAYTYISISDNKILLNTHLPEDLNYGIRYLENESQHYAIEFKVNQADNVSCGADIDDGIPQEFENAPIVQSAGVSTLIDIMVLYTPNAKSWADANEGGINNTVNQAFIRANNALTVSETGVTYNLVHSGQVSYTESGSSGTDLDRLRLTSDGHMDEVHTSRAHKGADLISLFTDVEDTGGLGYLFTGSSALGFNITRVKQASWTYTMVHEFGHNMGCGHHSDQATQPGPGSFSYASGFRWSGHRSVMAYQKNGDSRTAHFSNPDVDHQGQATGNSTHDNVRCIETTKSAVANFVDSVDPFELKVYATDTKAFFSWA